DKTYTYLKTIEGKNNTSYNLKNLTSGTTYSYAVRSYKKIGTYTYNGEYSNILTTTTSPLKVKNLTVDDRTSTSITLDWDKVSRAEGYRIYRYNSESKKYELLDEVEGNEKTTYTDKKLVSGKNYSYKVKAYKKIGKYTY
ncbi:beta-mannanase, partial [Clostridium perfringens]